ncbi:hypothetical protein AGRO_1258 [Agrobacterium sp. ATCC 31749]|nr:hypothetical protein AGRO_1258 [Agrobacterium sp. ATCC 31749]
MPHVSSPRRGEEIFGTASAQKRASGGRYFFGDCAGFGWEPVSRIWRHSFSRRS